MSLSTCCRVGNAVSDKVSEKGRRLSFIEGPVASRQSQLNGSIYQICLYLAVSLKTLMLRLKQALFSQHPLLL